jgi:hypothetical protein
MAAYLRAGLIATNENDEVRLIRSRHSVNPVGRFKRSGTDKLVTRKYVGSAALEPTYVL